MSSENSKKSARLERNLFFDNFEHICKAQHRSVRSVCMDIGLGGSTPASWKKNKTIPRQDVLDRLAEELSCRVSDFFKEDDEVRELIDMREELRESAARVANLSRLAGLEEGQEALLDEAMSIDDNVRDIISIYEMCTNRQRNMLMRTVYDFEQQVLNA